MLQVVIAVIGVAVFATVFVAGVIFVSQYESDGSTTT